MSTDALIKRDSLISKLQTICPHLNISASHQKRWDIRIFNPVSSVSWICSMQHDGHIYTTVMTDRNGVSFSPFGFLYYTHDADQIIEFVLNACALQENPSEAVTGLNEHTLGHDGLVRDMDGRIVACAFTDQLKTWKCFADVMRIFNSENPHVDSPSFLGFTYRPDIDMKDVFYIDVEPRFQIKSNPSFPHFILHPVYNGRAVMDDIVSSPENVCQWLSLITGMLTSLHERTSGRCVFGGSAETLEEHGATMEGSIGVFPDDVSHMCYLVEMGS